VRVYEVDDDHFSLITCSAWGKFYPGYLSLPVTFDLEYSPASQLIITVEISTEDLGSETTNPASLITIQNGYQYIFEPWEQSKSFEVEISDLWDVEVSSTVTLLFTLSGTNKDSFRLESESKEFTVERVTDWLEPTITETTGMESGKTTLSGIEVRTSWVGKVYYLTQSA